MFWNFSDTRVVLDCTELFVQTPSSLENEATTYSHYKSHNTYKALVGISVTGAVVHVSTLGVEVPRMFTLHEIVIC